MLKDENILEFIFKVENKFLLIVVNYLVLKLLMLRI